MRKAYIQPEAQILSLASLDDFLAGSTGGTIGDNDGDKDDWETDPDPWA